MNQQSDQTPRTGGRRTRALPNVLMLTADAWRADRLSVYGYERPTTPELEKFARSATVCDAASTLGPFTQIACIQLFTSTRPFSYGGYDRGAEGRPDTLFKRFRDAGYRTSGLSTIHWVSPYYGYTEGLDEEIGVFHLNTLVGMAVVNMRDTLTAYHAKWITAERMLDDVVPVVRKLFCNVEDYCEDLAHNQRRYRRDFPDSKVANDGYDFRKVRRVVAHHRVSFETDPVAYVEAHLRTTPDAHEWIAGDWRLSRTPAKLLGEVLFRATNRIVGLFNSKLAGMRPHRFRLAVDAHAIARNVVGQLENRDRDRPFMIWAHFKDNHRPYVSGPGRHWFRHTPDYLEALGYDRDIDPVLGFKTSRPKTEGDREAISALYDAALRSTDEAMGYILDALERLGIADHTVIGIAGDHGEEFGEHGDFGHQCMQYEHNVRIPMLFRGTDGTPGRIDSLVTSLDWAPTMTQLAGIDPAPGWEGHPVTSDQVARRQHVLMENFCRGNCIFDHRPLYLGVRTRSHKFLWKEYVDPTHKRGSPEAELYDLAVDPDERTNIYRPDHPLVAEFNRLIARRMAEIPEISKGRIAAAFGPDVLSTEPVEAR